MKSLTANELFTQYYVYAEAVLDMDENPIEHREACAHFLALNRELARRQLSAPNDAHSVRGSDYFKVLPHLLAAESV